MLLLVIDEVFHIAGRGFVVAPPIPGRLVNKAATVAVRLLSPSDGSAMPASGRITLEHLRLVGGVSRYQWVLLLDEGTTKPPPGTKVLVEQCDPVDALNS
jgi:hypothetical protein